MRRAKFIDGGEKRESDWQIATPAQIQFIGPSQCGKSTRVLQLLEDDGAIFDRAFRQVIYAAPAVKKDSPFVNQLRSLCVKKNKHLLLSDTVPRPEEIRRHFADDHVLLILDDLMCFPSLAGLTELSSMHAHHSLITCVYCLQNPYQKSKKTDLTTLTRNCTGRFIFFQTNDWRLYGILNGTLFPDRKGFLTESLLEAKQQGYNYIFVNTHSFTNIPRRFMCYTALFQEERKRFGGQPLFFDLQSGER